MPIPTAIDQDGNFFDITGGTASGSNLFHSFGGFSVGTGDVANFSGPDSIANVIGRVTGAERSVIEGTIRSSIPDANLFLLNPRGVVFGPGASLEVSGSFHASTADFLQFQDGSAFRVSDTAPVLSTASPTAFGFLNASRGDLLVSEAHLRVDAGESLSLVGSGNRVQVRVNNSSVLDALGGNITIAQTPPGSTFSLSSSPPTAPPAQLANLAVPDKPEANRIFIRAGALTVSGGALVGSRNVNTIDAHVEKLEVKDGGQISTRVSGPGIADAGDINIRATDSAFIGGQTQFVNRNISVTVKSTVEADVSFGGGKGGRISIETPELVVKGGEISSANARDLTDTESQSGTAGGIDLKVSRNLALSDGAEIRTDIFGGTNAGEIGILGGESVSLSGKDTTITSSASEGNAGSVRIDTPLLRVEDGAAIATDTAGSGEAGNVEIATDHLIVEDAGKITSSTSGRGKGGNIAVQKSGGTVELHGDSAAIESETLGAGDAGELAVTAQSLSIRDGARLSARTVGAGAGGNINIVASGGTVVVDGSSQRGLPSTITTESAATLANGGDAGPAGTISLRAGRLLVSNGGEISAKTSTSSQGGNVSVSANDIEINGGRISGTSTKTALNISRNPIEGRSGDLFINAPGSLRLRDGGEISVQTAEANAGEINVQAGELIHLRSGRISTSAADGAGDGGNISIDPVFVVLDNGSEIVARAKQGSGGNINIVSDFFFQSPDSTVDASSELGIDGNVDISSPDADVISGTLLLPESFLDPSGLLDERCAARAVERISSFVVTGRQGTSRSPDALLPAAPPIPAPSTGRAAAASTDATALANANAEMSALECSL